MAILDDVRKLVAEASKDGKKIKISGYQEEKIRDFEKDLNDFTHSYGNFLNALKDLDKMGLDVDSIEKEVENKISRLA